MMKLIVVLISVLFGSFYNTCIYRNLSGESVLYPPSYCPNCRHSLKPLDLVPIFSYIFLLGRCRYCKSRISLRYPIIEAITAILHLLLYRVYGLSWQFFAYLPFVAILIIISFIDMGSQVIPNSLIIWGLGFGILLSAVGLTTNIDDALLGFGIGLGTLLIITLLSSLILGKEAMGGGDIKLLGMVGFFLGWRLTLLTLLLSIYIGGIFSLILLLFKIKKREDYIPFGPFIALASMISLLWGKGIILWYASMAL